MGGSHSLEISDSDEENDNEEQTEEEENYDDAEKGEGEKRYKSSERVPRTPSSSSIDEVEAKLRALKLKYPSSQTPNLKNTVKLYIHIVGNTPKAKWVTSEKLTSYSFIKTSRIDGDDGDNNDDEDENDEGDDSWWVLKISSKIRVKVAAEMQLKTLADQRRVDFVAQGVWAVKFFSEED
ncbi:protein CYPRO4 [Quillaja saponaria]|uniref:Protein CYPRO4 n=1 Tax=Quillaja saponaria TaxID=32244 RepID=A0AAD7PT80_QUISA|nr:protein CYPRO4 [Quillaja saponaria]